MDWKEMRKESYIPILRYTAFTLQSLLIETHEATLQLQHLHQREAALAFHHDTPFLIRWPGGINHR